MPAVEDEILVRLAMTRFETAKGQRSQMDKFLAVARMEQLRSEPMDAETALNFAQAFGPYEHLFPYFATLTGMRAKQVRELLGFARRLDSADLVLRHQLLGVFHSISEILCIGHFEDRLSAEYAAREFGSLCARLSSAKAPSEVTDIAMQSVRSILGWSAAREVARDPDKAIREVLGVESDSNRRAAFAEVLRLQSVPSLSQLQRILDAAAGLASGKGDLQVPLDSLGAEIRSLPIESVSDEIGFEAEKKRLMTSLGPTALRQAHARLSRAATRRKVRVRELLRQAASLRGSLLPHLTTALMGVVYAYYLWPEDLPVAGDPLFLRKHEFYNVRAPFEPDYFPQTSLKGRGESTGT